MTRIPHRTIPGSSKFRVWESQIKLKTWVGRPSRKGKIGFGNLPYNQVERPYKTHISCKFPLLRVCNDTMNNVASWLNVEIFTKSWCASQIRLIAALKFRPRAQSIDTQCPLNHRLLTHCCMRPCNLEPDSILLACERLRETLSN